MKKKLVIAGSAMLLALASLAQDKGTATNTKDKEKACCSSCTAKCGCTEKCCTNGKCDKSKGHCDKQNCTSKDCSCCSK